ncbi:hypothetical protein CDAR_218181 [Caerostris darwini]|uniref:Uncharacterized protein n=1 Tax=Caerostris darwini TaxID=1538125 RepID=A0AAV4W630_9ARAC|nr:hypothetical protein CDAR_218181 [Caerostris darwini]
MNQNIFFPIYKISNRYHRYRKTSITIVSHLLFWAENCESLTTSFPWINVTSHGNKFPSFPIRKEKRLSSFSASRSTPSPEGWPASIKKPSLFPTALR